MKQKISKFKDMILNLMFPNDIKCMFCAGELNQNAYNMTCEECMPQLPFIKNPCLRCGSPLNENQQGVCVNCKSKNLNFVQAKSVFEYVELPLKVVHDVKYSGKSYLIEHMVKYMLDEYGAWNVFADIVTDVAMFPTKEKERGFNQSTLMAKEFAEKAKIPYIDLCAKIVDTKSQTTLNTKDRIKNVEDSFVFKPEYKKEVEGKIVLIIDDIVTTGATTSEISKVLLKAGAKECYVLSFAHTCLEQINHDEL